MTAASPAVWLLDVDGVVNARRPGWGQAPRHGHASAGCAQYRICWAPGLAEALVRHARDPRVSIVWCTTWCPWADQIERLLGLPALGRAWADDLNGYAASAAKLKAARDVLALGRRLVWTDDLEVPTPQSDRVLWDELVGGGNALLIRPDPRRGLCPDDLALLDGWLSGNLG